MRGHGRDLPAGLLDDGSERRFSELIVPASVILAGVLVVVVFAVGVTLGIRSRERPVVEVPVRPPALGTGPLAPDDQAPIPIPSSTASGSANPSPSVTRNPPPSRSRTRPTTPPVDTGAITIRRDEVPSRVDLSAEGTRDWVHWGEQNTFSLERRADGGFAILEGTPTAPRFRHALSPQRFVWEDGSPVDRSNGTPTGIRTCGTRNGFAVTAPAGRGNRTLRLYVGVSLARGRLDARLSSGGQRVSATLQSRAPGMDTAVFTLAYRAPRNGSKITIDWVTEASFDSDCGGVALQAATFR
jgi:hypothetical protein